MLCIPICPTGETPSIIWPLYGIWSPEEQIVRPLDHGARLKGGYRSVTKVMA
jgi:hypothetical protein